MDVLIVMGVIIAVIFLGSITLIYFTDKKRVKREAPTAKVTPERVNIALYPSVLWILPIVYGLIGGIIAAMFASIKYHSPWGRLFLVGLIVQVIVVAIILLLTYYMFISPLERLMEF